MTPSRNYLKQKVRHTRSKKGKEYWYVLEGTQWRNVSKQAAINARYGYRPAIQNGKVSKYVKQYLNQSNLLFGDRNKFEDIIDRALQEGKNWTIQQVQAIAIKNRIAIAIANTGLDANQLAIEWGVTVPELLDPDNWIDSDTFRNPNTGATYQVTWNYDEGSSWVRI